MIAISLTLGLDEVDHLAVVLEHVHLLDGRDVGHTDPLEGRCELLVVCSTKAPSEMSSESVATQRVVLARIKQNPLRARNQETDGKQHNLRSLCRERKLEGGMTSTSYRVSHQGELGKR